MTSSYIDLRSDTVTKPDAEMRKAMADAEVGDDVLDHDPTMAALEEEVAHTLGLPAALWVPSGSMGNLIALMLHLHRAISFWHRNTLTSWAPNWAPLPGSPRECRWRCRTTADPDVPPPRLS